MFETLNPRLCLTRLPCFALQPSMRVLVHAMFFCQFLWQEVHGAGGRVEQPTAAYAWRRRLEICTDRRRGINWLGAVGLVRMGGNTRGWGQMGWRCCRGGKLWMRPRVMIGLTK